MANSFYKNTSIITDTSMINCTFKIVQTMSPEFGSMVVQMNKKKSLKYEYVPKKNIEKIIVEASY